VTWVTLLMKFLWRRWLNCTGKWCRDVNKSHSYHTLLVSSWDSAVSSSHSMPPTEWRNQELGKMWKKSLSHLKYYINTCKIWGFHSGDYEEWCLWVVTPCGSCKNRRFGGTWPLLHQGDKNRWTRNNTSCN
jgi:hypothetical protein